MFRKMKIGAKLITGFLVVAIIAGAIGGVGIYNMRKLNDADTFLYEKAALPLTYLVNMTEYFQRVRVNIHKVLLAKNKEEMNKYFNNINNYSEEIVKNSELFKNTIVSDEAQKEFEKFLEYHKVYSVYLDKIEELIKSDQMEEATTLINGDAMEAAAKEQEGLRYLVDSKIRRADKTSQDNTKQANLISLLMISVAVFGFIISLILGIFLSLSITRPVKEATKLANSIADGDLNLIVPDIYLKRGDEIGLLSKEYKRMIDALNYKLNIVKQTAEGSGDFTIDVELASDKDIFGKTLAKMLDSLNDILGQVNSSIEQVASGSSQVAQASQSLSQGATEQASSLEEITSSITEISSQAKQNADNALQANGLSKQAMGNAEGGNKQMQDLVTAMGDINKSADMIKKIVKVIDDIAFQTNLLALNANVEAARAGKYGKGFAVVAEEVRNLAGRSATSVQETTQMVEEAMKNIDTGNKLVDATAKQLAEIMNSSSRVADLVEEIATASKEQTQGLDQINQGLGQIDQVTQSNTANAEESASAAEELASQSQQLKAIIGRFKLKDIGDVTMIGDGKISLDLMKKVRAEIEKNHTETSHLAKIKEINNKKSSETKKDIIASPKDIIKLDDDEFGKF